MNEIKISGFSGGNVTIVVPENLVAVVMEAFEHIGFNEKLSQDEVNMFRDLFYAFESIDGGLVTIWNVRYKRQ